MNRNDQAGVIMSFIVWLLISKYDIDYHVVSWKTRNCLTPLELTTHTQFTRESL
jgi:hypothetical protein